MFCYFMNGEEGVVYIFGEKLGFVKDYVKEGVESVKEGGKCVKD